MDERSGYDALMHEVSVQLGFCGSIRGGQVTHVDFIIPPNGPVTADQFVEWVFLADGLNPNVDAAKWQPIKDKLRAAFVKHMGGQAVNAEQLQWSFASAADVSDGKFRGPLPE
jgi:hypothetical protein